MSDHFFVPYTLFFLCCVVLDAVQRGKDKGVRGNVGSCIQHVDTDIQKWTIFVSFLSSSMSTWLSQVFYLPRHLLAILGALEKSELLARMAPAFNSSLHKIPSLDSLSIEISGRVHRSRRAPEVASVFELYDDDLVTGFSCLLAVYPKRLSKLCSHVHHHSTKRQPVLSCSVFDVLLLRRRRRVGAECFALLRGIL